MHTPLRYLYMLWTCQTHPIQSYMIIIHINKQGNACATTLALPPFRVSTVACTKSSSKPRNMARNSPLFT